MDEFWSLTPAEIFELARGYEERMDTHMHLLAWHAANVMNVHLKKKVTVKSLLGKQKKMTEFDRADELKKLKKVLAEQEAKSLGGNDCESTN